MAMASADCSTAATNPARSISAGRLAGSRGNCRRAWPDEKNRVIVLHTSSALNKGHHRRVKQREVHLTAEMPRTEPTSELVTNRLERNRSESEGRRNFQYLPLLLWGIDLIFSKV